MARPINEKPTENVALVVGLAVEVATVLGIKLPPDAANDALKAAPFVLGALPHVVTFIVDAYREAKHYGNARG